MLAKPAVIRRSPGVIATIARGAVLQRMARLNNCKVTVTDYAGTKEFGSDGDTSNAPIAIQVHDPSLYIDVAAKGALGAGEAYIAGKWSVTDLTALVRLLLTNRDILDDLGSRWSGFYRPLLSFGHWLNRNTRRQSRRNIGAHYDLGNELFELFLDPAMMYSSAIYPHRDASLEEASIHKLDLICRKLHLGPDDHLLEIGTGWGGLALHAAKNYGCRVTTTTISQQQFRLATRRVKEAGLDQQITVLDRDYRDLTGQYDKLVSVEMIEAVGPRFLETYFEVCSERLKPHGRMLLQAILISDDRYSRYLKTVDFIKKYIFPGGALPAMSIMQDCIRNKTDMRMVHRQDISADYARTLREWYRRFMARIDDVRRLGYPDEFIRMWQYYFCYCEGGFLEKTISDVQLILDKPACELPIEA